MLPCTATDLYSLAVFLFMIFVRGHPLEGIATEVPQSAAGEHGVDPNLALHRNFGFNPRFVFHPEDESNRPPPGDTRFVYWSIYPRFFKTLFVNLRPVGVVQGHCDLVAPRPRPPDGLLVRAHLPGGTLLGSGGPLSPLLELLGDGRASSLAGSR
jgi:hypothetical protein